MPVVALLALAVALALPLDARPNVLIVVGDDIAASDMAHMPMPTVDELAARGLRFRRAYGNPTCSPSRWSLTFGQYQTRDAGPVCDGYGADTAPSTSQASLPKLFAGAGYRTALFGKWHLGSHPGVLTGEAWEETPRLHGYQTWRAGLAVNIGLCGSNSYAHWLRVDDGHSALSNRYLPDAIRDAFLGWHAEQQELDAPWFAMVCFQLPHTPIHTAPGTLKKPRTLRDMYESQALYLDKTLAAMLAVVDLERTLVIFLADNGTEPGAARPDQDRKKVKTTTFEDGIRIPLVWAGPGVPAGVETDSIVHLADFLPTFAELLGADLGSARLDGTSLLPVLASPQRAVHEYVWSGVLLIPGGDYAVVTSRYKLRRAGGEYELYDLDLDPSETTNLVGREDLIDLEADLRAKLERHVERR